MLAEKQSVWVRSTRTPRIGQTDAPSTMIFVPVAVRTLWGNAQAMRILMSLHPISHDLTRDLCGMWHLATPQALPRILAEGIDSKSSTVSCSILPAFRPTYQ